MKFKEEGRVKKMELKFRRIEVYLFWNLRNYKINFKIVVRRVIGL